MKRSIHGLLVFVSIVMLAIPGCGWFTKEATQPSQEPALRIIDVNTKELFNDAHILGATHVEFSDLEKAASEWSKKTPLVVYCSDYSCTASHSAAMKFKELGFEDVAVYAGGIHEWYSLSKTDSEKYPLEGKAEMAFLKKDVKKVESLKEEANVVGADQLAQRLKKK